MILHHVRNATFILEIGSQTLIIDPMLGDVGSMMGLRFFKGERKRNPLVPLPPNCNEALKTVDACIMTHLHPDHLDEAAIVWLKDNNIPVYAHPHDIKKLRKHGLSVQEFSNNSLGLTVEAIPALHGRGILGKLMGHVSGWFMALTNEPTLYITADSVLTDDVKNAISRLQPDVIIAPAGAANFGIGSDILFPLPELVQLARLAPKHIVFHHVEALDHCPVKRSELQALMQAEGLMQRCFIPTDGQKITFAIDE